MKLTSKVFRCILAYLNRYSGYFLTNSMFELFQVLHRKKSQMLKSSERTVARATQRYLSKRQGTQGTSVAIEEFVLQTKLWFNV